MPRPRFATLDADTRRQILGGAAAAFRHGGLHGASLNQILAATGFSKGLFYYHFDDKKDLYATVLDDAIRQFETIFDRHPPVGDLTTTSFWGGLESRYRDLFSLALRSPAVVELVKTLSDLPPEEVEQMGVDARCLSWLHRYLQRGQTLGVVRTDLPLDVLTQLASAVDASLGQWLIADADERVEVLDDKAPEIVEMFRRLLQADVRLSQ